MTAIHVEVTADDVVAAGAWPRHDSAIKDWKNPVELALGRLTGVDVDVDGDEESWHATIGTMEGSTLVGVLLDPIAFDIELDDWIVALFARSTTLLEEAEALVRHESAEAVS